MHNTKTLQILGKIIFKCKVHNFNKPLRSLENEQKHQYPNEDDDDEIAIPSDKCSGAFRILEARSGRRRKEEDDGPA
jgi:hypothetical protein